MTGATPGSRRRLALVALASLIGAGACDFGVGGPDAGSGCARVHQGDGYQLPLKRVVSGAIVTRLTQNGMDVITERVKELVLAFFDADAQGRAVIPLARLGVGSLGTSLGPLAASVRDVVLVVDLASLDVSFVPGSSPPRIRIRIRDADVGLADGAVTGTIDAVLFTGDVACRLENGANDRVARMDLDLGIELATAPDGTLAVRVLPSSFDVKDLNLRVTTDCTLSECLDGNSPPSTSECTECEIVCPAADLGSALVSVLRDAFDPLVDSLLDLLADDLANLVLDGFLNGRPLAIEGTLDVAAMFGPALRWLETARPLGLLARPGASAFRVTGAEGSLGLDVLLDAGVDAAPPHPCVGELGPDLAFTAGPRPDLDGLVVLPGEGAVPYDLGVGVSEAVMNEAIWALYKSGALCIDLTTRDLATATGGALELTARTLDLLLPGVSGVAGPDAPVRVALRPHITADTRRVIQLGDGVTAPTVGVRLEGAELAVDVLVGDQYTRVLDFRADLVVGLAFDALPGGVVEVRLDGVSLAGLTTPADALFAEARLDVIAPFVVDLALGFLAARPISFQLATGGLGDGLGIPLTPAVLGLGPAGDARDWLAVYIGLDAGEAAPTALRVPPVTLGRPADGRLPFTVVGGEGDLEVQLRVANGPWSRWFGGGGPQVLEDARLWLVGSWPVEARARRIGGFPTGAELVGRVIVAAPEPTGAGHVAVVAAETRPEGTPVASDAPVSGGLDGGCTGGRGLPLGGGAALALALVGWLARRRRRA